MGLISKPNREYRGGSMPAEQAYLGWYCINGTFCSHISWRCTPQALDMNCTATTKQHPERCTKKHTKRWLPFVAHQRLGHASSHCDPFFNEYESWVLRIARIPLPFDSGSPPRRLSSATNFVNPTLEWSEKNHLFGMLHMHTDGEPSVQHGRISTLHHVLWHVHSLCF
jgi:hypothetical protein